jgi:hypothetical protein
MFTATINLNVPALPDNDVAFLNNAAWQNYWANVNLQAAFGTNADTTLYVEHAFDPALDNVQFVFNNITYSVPSIDQFNSLLAAYEALNTSYKELRDVLKTNGFITNSQ